MARAGAVGALASAIGAAARSRHYNERANNELASLRRDNRAWYDRRMAQDYTMRSDVQATLKKQRELLDEQYRRARATNAVAGGTDESLALQQQAANRSLSNTMTDVAANASAHKDNVEAAYRQQNLALAQQQIKNDQQQAASVAQAGAQGVNAGLNLVGNGVSSIYQQKAQRLNAKYETDPDELYKHLLEES